MKNTSIINFISLTSAIALPLSWSCKPERSESDKDNADTRPNILLIVSEDNGPDLGCYGVEEVSTPNLDRLAEQGVMFQNAFVTYSVCSPSRSTIFTGLYPHQNGQIGLSTHKYRMYKSFKTIPVYLKENGYRTGCLGKIHVNPESAIPFDFHPIKESNFAKKDLPVYAAYADTFMRISSEPFFLMVNFPDAHLPLQDQVEGMPARPLKSEDIKYTLPFVGTDSPRLRENTTNYYNCMNRLDEATGMLLKKLELSGKFDNTLIIYLSDHGPQFSRGKCTNYEAALRIPLIISWPGNMKLSQIRKELISTVDLLPTILHAAGIEIPAELPGFSLFPLIRGEEVKEWREYIFAGGAGSFAPVYFPKRSIRDDRYKLITNLAKDRENPVCWYYQQGEGHFSAGTNKKEIESAPEIVRNAYATWQAGPIYELYDLFADPYEFNNLADDPYYTDVMERLKNELFRWQAETDDPFADPAKYQGYKREVDSVMNNNPGYARDPDFEWKYPEYFYMNN